MNENLETDRELKAEIKLYYDLYVPENADSPVPLLIALHGYGAHKYSMMREARKFAPANFAIATLQGFHQHWREPEAAGSKYKVGFGWLTSYKPEDSVAVHHRALLDLIETLVREGIAVEKQVFLLGFSQSCALNFRFAFSNPGLLRGIIGICGGIPGDWSENQSYRQIPADVFYLYGTRDEFYPLEQFEENAEKLKSRAPGLRSQTYDSAHEITDEMRADIGEWLTDKTMK